MAREVTSDGDTITASASAGTLYFLSNQKSILTRCGCGSILSILPTRTPRIRTSSPTKMPVLLSKYPTACNLLTAPAERSAATTPAISTATNATANTVLALRGAVIVLPPSVRSDPVPAPRAPHPAPAQRPGWVSARAWMPAPAGPAAAGPVAVRRAAGPEAAAGRDNGDHPVYP